MPVYCWYDSHFVSPKYKRVKKYLIPILDFLVLLNKEFKEIKTQNFQKFLETLSKIYKF